jgi:hypothetical protein
MNSAAHVPPIHISSHPITFSRPIAGVGGCSTTAFPPTPTITSCELKGGRENIDKPPQCTLSACGEWNDRDCRRVGLGDVGAGEWRIDIFWLLLPLGVVPHRWVAFYFLFCFIRWDSLSNEHQRSRQCCSVLHWTCTRRFTTTSEAGTPILEVECYSVLPSLGKHHPPPPFFLIVWFDEPTLWIIVSRKEHLLCSYCYLFDMLTQMTMSAIHVVIWLSIGYYVSGGGHTRCKLSSTPLPFFFFWMES